MDHLKGRKLTKYFDIPIRQQAIFYIKETEQMELNENLFELKEMSNYDKI